MTMRMGILAGAAAFTLIAAPASACGLFTSACGSNAYEGYGYSGHHAFHGHRHGHHHGHHAHVRHPHGHRHHARQWVYDVAAYPPPTPRYYVNQGPTYSGPGPLPFKARYEDRDIRMGYSYVHGGYRNVAGHGYRRYPAHHGGARSARVHADAEIQAVGQDELIIHLRRRP